MIIPHGSKDWIEAVCLREEILRKPLGSAFSEEELAAEVDHIQVVGKQNNAIVATAVLVLEEGAMKMQRVVVQSELRDQNIGSNMMDFCELIALESGYIVLYCHARDSAVRFYKNNNWLSEGAYFDEDGIPHLKMMKQIKVAD